MNTKLSNMEGKWELIESTFNRPNRIKERFKSVAKKADSKMWKLGRNKPQRTDRNRLLMENNNTHDGFNGCDHPAAQNDFNTQVEFLQTVEEGKIKYEELAELLQVSPDVSEDGSRSVSAVCLIQRSVSQHFPELPADLDQNLQQHLSKVQEAVCNELVKLGPLLETMGLMDCLIDCYHCQTFHHLSDILQKVHSSQNSLVLMKWVLHTYLSPDLLSHPDLQRADPIKKVDLLLIQEWVVNARGKLLYYVQKEVRASLEKILQIERNQTDFDCEEAFVGFYVDTIQCIEAVPREAQKVSQKLSVDVREVCFKELLTFLEKYSAEQEEILGKKAKLDKPEMIPFFKTLTTCSEIKHHVQTTAKAVKGCHLEEIVETLENMEDITLTLLKQIVADMAERNLKSYFQKEDKQFCILINLIKTDFAKDFCPDVKKRVMNEVYKLITHIYLKHLVRSSKLSKLTKRWGCNVGWTVTEDAELLHKTISNLAPGVQQWNLMLLRIKELLECQSIVAVQLTVGRMQKECPTWREDQDLLPALLRWKGLSWRRVNEVLNILPGQQPRSRSTVSCFSWIFCWGGSTITSMEEHTSDC